ncbi:MAG TPA: formylglycine-generating enzyme family protein [Acidobacteriota bacterium]|nr:formylglycine-generating enzyme family protein [Acidobacteriota bacterium]
MLNRSSLSCSLLAAFALLLAGSLLAAPPGEDSRRLGWHGEEMPQGLKKAEAEGEYIWIKDGSVMVYVPAGTFTMGSEEGDSDEMPVRQVYLDAFYIDKYEVSNRLWRRSGLPLPPPPSWGIQDQKPVVNVDWNDVQKYMQWSGKRLPSEAEWEKAARGTDGRTYPWGDDPPRNEYLIWEEHPVSRESIGDIGCCPQGASPYGAVNMAGNVYEWCQDWYDAEFYQTAPQRNPVNDKAAKMRVLRGGAFVHKPPHHRTSYRYRLYPFDKTPYIGFRCVLSAPAGEQSENPQGGI